MPAVDVSRFSRLLIPLLIALAVADRLGRVDGVVDGEHAWRQGHIASNVEMMLQRGVFASRFPSGVIARSR